MGLSLGKHWLRQLQGKVRTAGGRGETKCGRRATLRVETLETRVVPTAFTAGDLVVVRVGTGAASLGDTSTAAFLDEYTTAGTLVQSIALPTTASAGINPLTLAGNATAEGELSLSTDGQYLLLAGFDTGTGTSAPDSGSSGIGDTIAEVNAAGAVDTTTVLSGSNAVNTEPRAAFSTDGTNIWLAGQDGTTGGARYINGVGSTTATNLSGTALKNIRNVEVWNGQLFVAQDKVTGSDLETLGTGAPRFRDKPPPPSRVSRASRGEPATKPIPSTSPASGPAPPSTASIPSTSPTALWA